MNNKIRQGKHSQVDSKQKGRPAAAVRKEQGFKFIKSAVHPNEFPIDGKAEVALVGRSNAGKSSFLNAWAGRIIAKVSSQPGKTCLLNFFEVEGRYRVVDMPGYGYAVRSRDEIVSWQQMIENYLLQRENLKGLILIMDIRRDWQEEEEMLAHFVRERDLPLVVVLNKADKMSRSNAVKRAHLIRQSTEAEVFFVSSLKKTNLQEVRDCIFSKILLRKN